MAIAVFPGSFDPVTKGHLDVVHRASALFEKVLVLVAESESKRTLFTVEERVGLAKTSLRDIKNVSVHSFDGLTVEFAKKHGAGFLIRSLRSGFDFEHEMGIAQANQILAPGIDTIFLSGRAELSFLSSSLVREIAKNQGELGAFVTAEVAEALRGKFKRS